MKSLLTSDNKKKKLPDLIVYMYIQFTICEVQT